MADDDAPSMDYPEHERTYDRFLWLAKYTTIATVVLLVLMAIFLV